MNSVALPSLPFFDSANGTFALPPLACQDLRRGSLPVDAFDRSSHSRHTSLSSSTTSSFNSQDLPSLATLSLSPSSSRSPSPSSPPKIPHGTRPSHRHSSSTSSARPMPAFKLIPQPMIDPSKRSVRPTDALVVFPATAGISQASQRKAKLLVGKDIETYFDLQERQGGSNGARAYAYKMVWERRWSQTFVSAFSKAAAGSRRGSRVEFESMDCE